MANSIKVFVSATSADLGSFRDQVSNWILDMGWHPIVQSHFAPDHKTVTEMLQKRIRECDAVIHIVGECYGAEPQMRPKDALRSSYTQIEAGCARKMNKRLFTVLLDEHFPYDPHAPESAELSALQAAYRRQVTTGDHLYIPCRAPGELEREIRKLRVEVDKLRKSRVRTALLFSTMLIVFLTAGFYALHARQRDIRNVLDQVIEQTSNTPSDHSIESQKQAIHAAVYRIASESGMDPDALGKKLDGFIAETAANRAASLRDQALAAFAGGDNTRTERLAENAAANIQAGPGSDEFKRLLIRDMHMLSADAASNQNRWSQAETYSRRALENTNPEIEAAVYTKNGLMLGDALQEQKRYDEAVDAVVKVKTAIDGRPGNLEEDRVELLNDLANLQLLAHRLADSEGTLEESIRLSGRAHSSNLYPETVYAYTLIAGVLTDLGRDNDAGKARERAEEIVVRARAAGNLEAETCELSRSKATLNLLIASTEQETEDLQAYNSKPAAWAARLDTRIRLYKADDAALKSKIRTLQVSNWSLKGAVTAIIFGLCLGLWDMLRTPRRPRKPSPSSDPELAVQQLDRYIKALELYRESDRRYRDEFLRFFWIFKWTCLVACFLGAFGFAGNWLGDRISGAPERWNELTTALRGDVDFAEKAFGTSSKEHLQTLVGLADNLGSPPDRTSRYQSEAEAIYRRVILLRRQDVMYSREELAGSMEGLSVLLKEEGKNSEADDWNRQARNLRMSPGARK